jgi:hypothetical protein
MPATFYRLSTDGTRVDVALEGSCAGPATGACWLIGGGPGLAGLPCAKIAATPVPKMCVNLAGTRLLRPTFWTSYDPSVRFHRSVYLDAGVMKFVHRRRSMDLVPETTYKVCDCPSTFFFDRDGERGFADFVAAGNRGIVDWSDSMVQAIDILYRLGFRVLYLAGCEMRVAPSAEQIARGAAVGVTYDADGLLSDFVRECAKAGLEAEELDRLPSGRQYHFDEQKPIRAAANTDLHYFRIAQYLRLSRRAMGLAGLRLVSVTPGSRLNDYFPYEPVRSVLARIAREVGDPSAEPVRGLYRQEVERQPAGLGPMRDYRPKNWSVERAGNVDHRPACAGDGELIVEAEGMQRLAPRNGCDAGSRLGAKLARMPEGMFEPVEDG